MSSHDADEMERILEDVAARMADGDIGDRELTVEDIARWERRPKAHLKGTRAAVRYPGELTPIPPEWERRLARMAAKRRGEVAGEVWDDGMATAAAPRRPRRPVRASYVADKPPSSAKTATPRKPPRPAERQMVLL